jgi:hypothetical protein
VLSRAALLSACAVASFTTAGDPSTPLLTIGMPAAGATITDRNIRVAVAVRDFQVECARAGQPGKPGMGHIHAMLDGVGLRQLTSVECAPRFTISGEGVSPGSHTLAIAIAADDHALVGPPATITFVFRPANSMPLPKPIERAAPSVEIEQPRNGATVDRSFDLRVALHRFIPSCDLEGKANVPGYGHLHVFVSQQGVTDQRPILTRSKNAQTQPMIGMIGMPCITTIPVDLSAWQSGPARISVVLVGDDHLSIGARPASVAVTVR